MERTERESPSQHGSAPLAAPEAIALSRALVEGTRDDVLVAGPEGRIQFISPGLARAAGASPGELTGEPADRALSVMELPSFSSLKAMLATVSSARTEAELVDETGERRTVLLRGVATRQPEARTRYVWFVTPLSRLRSYEWANRLMRSELQTQSRILALVSHELRTPLNIILAQLALLKEGLRGELPGEQMECVERASQAGHELLDQVNDLIDLANLESRQVEVHPEPLAHDRLLEMVRARAREELDGDGAGWRLVDEMPADRRVLADPERLEQILSKLLSNARKFGTGERGVTVALGPSDPPSAADVRNGDRKERDGETGRRPGAAGYVALEIRDDGDGIPTEARERVFEPFSQTDDVLDRRNGGSGLGLSIARQLARLQDGDLTVRSLAPRGTAFRLYLPLAE